MNFQIREAVTENVKGDHAEAFIETINDAIARGDEHLLPGLGVFLEKWWHAASETERKSFTTVLQKEFH